MSPFFRNRLDRRFRHGDLLRAGKHRNTVSRISAFVQFISNGILVTAQDDFKSFCPLHGIDGAPAGRGDQMISAVRIDGYTYQFTHNILYYSMKNATNIWWHCIFHKAMASVCID